MKSVRYLGVWLCMAQCLLLGTVLSACGGGQTGGSGVGAVAEGPHVVAAHGLQLTAPDSPGPPPVPQLAPVTDPPQSGGRLPELQTELAKLLGDRQASAIEPRPLRGQSTRSLPALDVFFPDSQIPAEGEPYYYRLSWTEQLPGDMDFNGEVNISDLQPLARYFGMSNSEHFAANGYSDQAKFRRYDADGNGRIGLGDLRGIAEHFMMQVAGYRVYRQRGDGSWEWMPGPGGSGDPYSVRRETASSANESSAHTGDLLYRFDLGQLAPGEQVWRVVPCHGPLAAEGDASYVSRDLLLAAGQSPPSSAAGLHYLTDEGWAWALFLAGDEVKLRFDFSKVLQEQFPVRLQLDFDGDAVYEEEETLAFGTGELERSYHPGPGFYPLVVRLTDSEGFKGYWFRYFNVRNSNSAPLISLTVDVADQLVPLRLGIRDSSLDPDNDHFEMVHLLRRTGQADQFVADGSEIWEAGNYTLVSTATDSLGASSTRETALTVKAGAKSNPGWTVSTLPQDMLYAPAALLNVAERPAIIFQADSGRRYQRALDRTGSSWPSDSQPVPALPAENQNIYTSYAAAGSFPAIVSFRGLLSSFNFHYHYAVAQDADGTAWTEFQDLAGPLFPVASSDQSLLLLDGRPALLYFDLSSGMSSLVPRLLRAQDAAGLAWPAQGQQIPALSGSAWRVGKIGGRLTLFSLGEDGMLRLLRAVDNSVSAWEEEIKVTLPPGDSNWRAGSQPLLFDIPGGRPLLLSTQSKLAGEQTRVVLQCPLHASLQSWAIVSTMQLDGPNYHDGWPGQQAVVDGSGRILLVYPDRHAMRLMLTETTDQTGTAWREPQVIDERGDCSGYEIRLVLVKDEPVVAFAAFTGPRNWQAGTQDVEYRIARRN